ncbi:aromatic ring-hydroxylating oxygenase subunit alpha [Pseudomonas sp. LRF_L74]|uniref:aromatic ring-hydroxylating oxygenase subunit alpha n=1 Tax=Pseudomonas sp. LRF_L74 TaxID=3369422 RepID=UPI003F6255C9
MSEVMTTGVFASDAGPSIPTNLSRDDYCSADIYAKELEKVFYRQWLAVGHISLVPAAGDYYVKQVGPESMIIAKDKEGRIRAYFNVCRHRGYRMLDDHAQGCTDGFVCPYHHWTYDLNGKLRTVPGTRDGQDFPFAEFPLHEAHCTVKHGFIFVWLGKDVPPTLDEALAHWDNDALIRKFEPEKLKLAHREIYTIDANWKAMMENDLECYHCSHGGHVSLAIACNFQGFYADKQTGQHFPLREGMVTFSMDGQRVCKKPLGKAVDGDSAGFLLWPFFCGPVFFVDHAVSLELTPMGVDKCQFICEWYVEETAVESVDYDVEKLIQVFHITNVEDQAFGERNYRGIQSSRFVPGALHPRREDGIIAAYDLYRGMMAAD